MKNHELTGGWLVVWILVAITALLVGNCVLAYGQANQIKAQWDSNTEPDLAGYRIYWSSEQGAYSNAFDIPLVNFVPKPDWNTIQTGWLTPGRWYFVATAYDTAGNESGFSNEVFADIPDVSPAAPGTIHMQITLPNGTVIDLEVTP